MCTITTPKPERNTMRDNIIVAGTDPEGNVIMSVIVPPGHVTRSELYEAIRAPRYGVLPRLTFTLNRELKDLHALYWIKNQIGSLRVGRLVV